MYDRETSNLDNVWKLQCNMRGHIVVLRVFDICGIQIEPSASAKIPVGIFSFDTCTARRGVGEENSNTLGGGIT